MSDRPYARHYYIDLARDYPAVWWDDRLYATYGRLLAAAEASWPAVPGIPSWAKPAAIRKLVDSTLVTLCPPHGYAIKGMDAERSARSNAARYAARIRHGNANGLPKPSQAKAKTNGLAAEPSLESDWPPSAAGDQWE